MTTDIFMILMNHDHSLFCLTRRAISAGGFFTTIQSITEVAAARAYLVIKVSITLRTGRLVSEERHYHVNMY